MNILFFTDTAVPHLGGKSSHILDLSAGLKEIGHNTDIISETSLHGARLFGTKLKKLFIQHYKKSDFGTFSYKSMDITDRAIQRLLKDYLKYHKVDVISAQDPISALYAYEIVRNNIPIVLTMHSYFGKSMSELSDDKTSMRQKDFDRLRDRDVHALDVVKALVAVDTRIKEDSEVYIQNCANKGLKCVSIPNFVNTNTYRPSNKEEKLLARRALSIPDDKKVMICIRRLVDKNGVFYAVQAMKNIEGLVLLVGGDGPNMGKLKAFVSENHLEAKVRFLGGVDGELKRNVYSAADYAIVPSITVNGLQEATSVSAIEAMSCGLTTIVSGIGGLKELIHNDENGVLVDEKNSEMIAKVLTELLCDEERSVRLATAARESVMKNYSHIAGARKYFDIYKMASSEKMQEG